MKPLRFQPLYQERVWGGRWMETAFGRKLPPGKVIGESWEIVDRPEAQSLLLDGSTSLHELWTNQRVEIFGTRSPDVERFPILVKILDASDKLSLQVHPPATLARELGGEPKTEMWYLAETKPDADLFAGLRPGITRESFCRAIDEGKVADCFHRIESKPGDCLFLPSGRVHAIGTGNLICEIQQNSDTTYRVYDWDRVGLDGKKRELHVEASLQCIDFNDVEPTLQKRGQSPLVQCEFFTVEVASLSSARTWQLDGTSFILFWISKGSVQIGEAVLNRGDFALLPASFPTCEVNPLLPDCELLWVTW